MRRAQQIEGRLGLLSIDGGTGAGGLFSERPSRTLRLFGLARVDRDRGLGLTLVYSAALAGWTYLVAWGAAHALGLGHARQVGGAIGVAVGLLLLAELGRIHQLPQSHIRPAPLPNHLRSPPTARQARGARFSDTASAGPVDAARVAWLGHVWPRGGLGA